MCYFACSVVLLLSPGVLDPLLGAQRMSSSNGGAASAAAPVGVTQTFFSDENGETRTVHRFESHPSWSAASKVNP